MDKIFQVCRGELPSHVDLRNVSLLPDVDKTLKAAEAHVRGLVGTIHEDRSSDEYIVVTITFPDDIDLAAASKTLNDFFAANHLTTKQI